METTMKISSAISNKGFVLYPFLLIFSSIIILLNGVSINTFQRKQEIENAYRLDEFSLVEIETLKQVKNQFLNFNPKNFEDKIGEWNIKVIFKEETAVITYQGDQTVTASMIYDTVFKNVLDYHLNETSNGNSD
jgi:hypothetical protein